MTQAQALASMYQEQFQIMANSAPVLIWIADTQGQRTWFNHAWLDFTGRSLEESIGTAWQAAVHPEDLNPYLEKYGEAFANKKDFKIEYRLRRKDGTDRWILNHGVPRFDQDQNFAGYIGSCIDIDDRRKAEEALHEAISARDEFLSIASHELKTPLTPMKLQVQNLARLVKRDQMTHVPAEQVLKVVEGADQQIKRLNSLIDNLLDLSRISAGKLSLILEPFDLADVVQTVLERFMPQLELADCRIVTHIESDLILHADFIRLEQLVSNLLSNAIKYAAGSLIEVSTGRGKTDDTVWFEVKDKGMGIKTEDQKRIFNRFERASGPGVGGLGLGLYISKQIVTAHGALLTLESEIGKGSTFRVEFPSAAFERG